MYTHTHSHRSEKNERTERRRGMGWREQKEAGWERRSDSLVETTSPRGRGGWGEGVTERAVYWPRKCSQAVGQSAWLLNSPLPRPSPPPPVSLTAYWLMKGCLYSAAHTIKRGVVYLPLHRTHTLSQSTSIPSSFSPSSVFTLLVSISPTTLSLNENRNPGSSNLFFIGSIQRWASSFFNIEIYRLDSGDQSVFGTFPNSLLWHSR